MSKKHNLSYNLENLPRELKQFYISANNSEISQMLGDLNIREMSDLYAHIEDEVKFKEFSKVKPLSYDENLDDLLALSKNNNLKPSFIGDSLRSYSIPEITPYICSLRGLTTAYTPYQPERSQGTLWTLWNYSNLIASITGFEAINASLYDRSTAMFEAALTARKISKHKGSKFLVSKSVHPNDIEVLKTLSKQTDLVIEYVELDEETGTTNLRELELKCKSGEYYGIVFSQTNNIGLVENFDEITNIGKSQGMTLICDVDIMEINQSGLKRPCDFGEAKEGVDIIIGEGQHLAIGPNFGGPGVGIFGVRYNKNTKTHIRSTPGRYVGKTVDSLGNEALCMVLSTREQHIRREKATSNICSNQSFLASIVGASLLERGSDGLSRMQQKTRESLEYFIQKLKKVDGIEYVYNDSTPLNQVPLNVTKKLSINNLISEGAKAGLHIGTNITGRTSKLTNAILISFNDIITTKNIDSLIDFFSTHLGTIELNEKVKIDLTLTKKLIGESHSKFSRVELDDLKQFYLKLSKLNVSPDDNIYPLGSCTMKYNPHINDHNASLPGFTDIHPQTPIEDAQGALEVLYRIQERFKEITGLPGVTTQPVAGAQGELVGIKLFQAYHQSKGEKRDIILIPKSAHGTNPATATMAGIKTYKENGIEFGIIPVDADSNGQIDLPQMTSYIQKYGKRIIGVMVTNPNTSGIFEQNFKNMAELIHQVDGLVYMDGANMNAIAGIVNLEKLGVDAVHNNLHKTWTIPHGGGGPGDAIVAVSKKLIDYLPGHQIKKSENGQFSFEKPVNSIGSFHRNFGNFAHKVRCLSYLNALGDEGIRTMASVAVLSSCYLYNKLKKEFPTLPYNAEKINRMHEFIITLSDETFSKINNAKIPKAQAIGKLGKLFLDFGIHAPTVSFPEPFGLMIEPTESYSKAELDKFFDVLIAIKKLLENNPEVLQTVPHFTPVKKVDEVKANKDLIISDQVYDLPYLSEDDISPKKLSQHTPNDVCELVLKKHQQIANG